MLDVVGIVSPWNYPGMFAFGLAIGAPTAGNRVTIKHSEIGPHFSRLLQEQVATGFASNEVVVVASDADWVVRSCRCPSITCSSPGRRPWAANLTPVTLELGGKSLAIAALDSKLALAAPRIVFGKLLNAGQICIAPNYVAVPRGQLDVDVTLAVARVQMCKALHRDDHRCIALGTHRPIVQAILSSYRWPENPSRSPP